MFVSYGIPDRDLYFFFHIDDRLKIPSTIHQRMDSRDQLPSYCIGMFIAYLLYSRNILVGSSTLSFIYCYLLRGFPFGAGKDGLPLTYS